MITANAVQHKQGRCAKAKRVKWLGGLAAGLLSLGVQAQLNVKTVESSSHKLPLKFPVVSGGEDSAMWRINAWLQVSELEKLPDRYKKNLFEDVLPKPDEALGIASLSYTVDANTPSFLSLMVHSTYTGMWLSDYSFHYNFDARTGRLISLADLFSPHGWSAFRGALRTSRLSRIDEFLAKSSHAAVSSNDSVKVYADCRKKLDQDDFMILGKDKLTVSLSCVKPFHGMLVFNENEPGPLDNEYPYAALNSMLNDYGHCLLLEQRADCVNPQHDLSHGLWHGTLNKRPITLVYGTYGTDGYFYDKYAKYIALQGGLQADGSLRFTEILRSGPNATLVLKRQADGSFKGSWTQEDAGKTRDIELTNEL